MESEADSDSDREKKGRAPKNVKPTKGARSQPPPREDSIPITKPKPYDRPVKKPRLSEKEIEAIRDKKAGERKEWGKRGSRGQPKLGSRVEMLLGRIKKGMENESKS